MNPLNKYLIAAIILFGTSAAVASQVSTPNLPLANPAPLQSGDLMVVTRGGVTYNASWPPTTLPAGTVTLGSSTTANPSISGDFTSGFYTGAAARVDVNISGKNVTEWSQSGLGFTTTSAAGTGFTGMHLSAPGALSLSTSGSDRVTWTATGVQVNNLNSSALNAALTGSVIQLSSPNAVQTRVEADVYGAAAFFTGSRSDGTLASPTTLQTNDEIAGFNSYGYNGAAVVGPQASVRQFAAAAWTTTSTPTYVDVATTPAASTTMGTVARFGSDGSLTMPATVTGGPCGAGCGNFASLQIGGVAVSTGGSGTVGSSAANQFTYYSALGTTVTGNSQVTYNTSTKGINLNGVQGIALPDAGLDILSIAMGPGALAAYATTSGHNVASGFNALNASTTGTDNTAVGYQALLSNLTDSGNTAVGSGSLKNMAIGNTTTLGANTAVGYNALTTSTTSPGNTAVGYLALTNATGGSGQNSVMGYQAGKSITTGFFNTLLGYNAGSALTTGQQNVAVGHSATFFSAITLNAVAIGYQAKAGANDVAVGQGALSQTAADTNDNVGVGTNAGRQTNGTNNAYVGFQAGQSSQGSNNTAIGSNTLENGSGAAVATGNNNTAVGANVLRLMAGTTTGNTGVGENALAAQTTGVANTAFGVSAGSLITTGSNNLAIGALAGTTSMTTGSFNILIGGSADTSTTSASHEFHLHDASLAAGTDAITITGMGTNTTQAVTIHGLVTLSDISSDVTHTDASVCEDTTTHSLYSGSGTLGVCLGTSSLRYKHGIQAIIEGLAQIKQLEPVNFFYNKGRGDNGDHMQYGFIAEDVVTVLPGLVSLDKDGKPNTVDILGMFPILVRAIQQQQQEIDELSPGAFPFHKCFFDLLVCAD